VLLRPSDSEGFPRGSDKKKGVRTGEFILLTTVFAQTFGGRPRAGRMGTDAMSRPTGGKMTPLHFAARDGVGEMVEFMLDHGADVNAPGEDGWTPLHFAAAHGHTFIVQFLLENGARVDASTSDGSTPIELAYIYERSSVIQILSSQGARPARRKR
jgi:hypothetical protein